MYHILHTKPFYWYTDESWQRVKLKSIAMEIINPLLISDEYFARGFIGNFIMYNKKVFFSTKGIILKTNNNQRPNTAESYKIADLVAEYLVNLRYASRQVRISLNDFIQSIISEPTIKLTHNPLPSPQHRIIPVWQSHISTAIDKQKLLSAEALMNKNIKMQPHNEIALDAYESYMGGDYRKTILYSAMSMEMLLNLQHDLSYKKIISSKSINKKYRVKKLSNEIFNREPVLENLMKSARYNFKMLLHEVPLYIYNYTFRYENQRLYEDINILHNTRNKIVHTGQIFTDKKEKLLPLSNDGAIKALETVRLLYLHFSDSFMNELLQEIRATKRK